MKQALINKFTFLTVALIFAFGAMTACSSTGKTTTDEKGAASGAEQNPAANENIATENKTAENKALSEVSTKTNGDIFASFKKGDDYEKTIRPKILKDGWQPAREEDADQCGSGDDTCDKFPEMNHCAGTGLGNCEFRWQKGERILHLYTIDDPQVYDSYKIEKAAQTSVSSVDQKWESFWSKFKTAINKKDKTALKSLMTKNIDGGGAVETSDERIAAIESSDMWSSMQKTVAAGTKSEKCDVPCRTSKDGYLVFTYENSEWKWSGLGGEGGGI